jgi:uncharacterized protein (DUF2141 family)
MGFDVVEAGFLQMLRLLAPAVVVSLVQLPVAGPLPAADGLIAGRVVDGATGRAVTGVVVVLTPRPAADAPRSESPNAANLPVRVLVDASGRFIFAGLRAGAYELAANRRGFVSGAFGKLRPDGAGLSFPLAEHERRTDVTLRVWKFGSIGGTVMDEMNEPVVGVNVDLLRREWVGGELRFNRSGASATTDDRGVFRIGSLLPGDYLVAVVSSTNTIRQDLLDAPNGASAEMKYALGQVGGVAQSSGHRDVQSAGQFVLHGAARSVIAPEPAADGRVVVYPSAFFPEAPGTVAQASTIAMAAGESKTIPAIRLRPTPALRVTGTVTGPAGGSSTTLLLMPQHVDGFAAESGFTAAKTLTDARGAFTFLGVTPGVYRLRAYTATAVPGASANAGPVLRSTYWLHETVTVGTTDLVLSLTMRPSLAVSGRLVFEGQRSQPRPEQIARDVVNVTPADGRSVSSLTGRSAAGTPGTFSIVELAGGRYALRMFATPAGWYLKSMTRGGADVIDVPFELSDDLSDFIVTYTDKPTTIRGTVRTTAGAADPESLIIVFPVVAQRWTDAGRTPIRMRSTRTAATGVFTVTGLPPGDYLVAAVADASASTWQTPAFLEALSRVATRIRLEEGTTINQDLRRVEVIR